MNALSSRVVRAGSVTACFADGYSVVFNLFCTATHHSNPL